jgi:hypothetical protein
VIGEDFDHDHEAVAEGVDHPEAKLAFQARVVASHLAAVAGVDMSRDEGHVIQRRGRPALGV